MTDNFTQEELIPVDIETFRNATRDIDFDVFLKLSEDNVAHVFSRATGLDYKRLAHYIQKGVRELLIKASDRKAYQAFVARPAHLVFNDPNTSQEKKIATLLNMTEQNMAELFTQFNVTDGTANYSQRLIRNYVDLMTQSPNTLAIILKLVSHGEYLYYHSIAVSIFSMFIAKASGQFNQRMLELVGMGGFLHDIGCTQISKEILQSPTDLTKEQWAEIKQHPKLGLNMIAETASIPDEVRYIVYQHHEEPSGQGYPNALHGPVIYYPAKIVSLADAFSALISKRPFRPAFTVERALEILQEGSGRHDRELLKITAAVFSRQVEKKAA
ncbi:MAG: HD domain-containing protein [Oligoflexia bacterium]|nr:HD domain-containing protein [Oligoflexia bacterium]